MPDTLIALSLILVAAAFALPTLRRGRAAEAAARSLAAERGRSLGQLAREMQALAFALLGHAATLPPSVATAIAAEARRLLQMADDLTEYLASEAGPRRLAPAPLPLGPLVEEAVAAMTAQLGPGRRQFRLAPDFAGLTLHADRRAARVSTCSSAPPG